MSKILRNQQFKTASIMLFLMLVVFFLKYPFPNLMRLIHQSLIDAYSSVTVFVALTLAIFYTTEKITGKDISYYLEKYKKYQVLVSAVMGALPGCGGAIIMVIQYTRGALSFGGLVACLTSTMGDAAFLLIATKPMAAIIVITMGIFVGAVSGYITDFFAVPNYIIKEQKAKIVKDNDVSNNLNCESNLGCKKNYLSKSFWNKIDVFWLFLLIPGIAIGFANALNMDINEPFKFIHPDFGQKVSFFAALFCVAIFFAAPKENSPKAIMDKNRSLNRKVVSESSFVTVWVIFGFAIYEIIVLYTGLDIRSFLVNISYLIPIIAILIGWIPGCGPQVIVTGLYVNGIIPFSGLIGNAISNDGDALFPALGIAPKASVLATIYTTIPAIIVAYGVYFFLE